MFTVRAGGAVVDTIKHRFLRTIRCCDVFDGFRTYEIVSAHLRIDAATLRYNGTDRTVLYCVRTILYCTVLCQQQLNLQRLPALHTLDCI